MLGLEDVKARSWIFAALALLTLASCNSGSAPRAIDPSVRDDGSNPGASANASMPPQNIRSVRYSPSVGEIFWDAPADGEAGVRYEVTLDGVVVDTRTGRSLLASALSPGETSTFSIVAIDAMGRRSEPRAGTLEPRTDASGGSGEPGAPERPPQPDSQPQPQTQPDSQPQPEPMFGFNLAIDRERATLDEGNLDGIRFSIEVAPEGNEPVRLALNADRPEFSSNLDIQQSADTLTRAEPRATIDFRLAIGMQPLLPATRTFTLTATSGPQSRQLTINLDVNPVNVPDVYLLIGQSNMVGSSEAGAKDVQPGGLDARSNRIYQLNVTPNNQDLFSDRSAFIDESVNAITPRYVEAEDPLHDPRYPNLTYKGGTLIGPSLSFAKAALAGTTRDIYLVPAAWGATGFCGNDPADRAWNASETDNPALGGTWLLERALTRLAMTLRDTGGILRGILWHQGGADSNVPVCAQAYADNLRLMVERLRREAPQDARGPAARGSSAPIPFIVGTQSRGRDERADFSVWGPSKQLVDGVHRNIMSVVPWSDWVNNDDLVPPAYPCGISSCVHFGAAALRETGNRYYRALQRIWARNS